MAIKLVLTDLDGTLLNEDRVIEEEGIRAIRRWKEKGGIFSFITGRPAFGVLGYAAQAGVNGPMVCCNGAELAGFADWENRDSREIQILKRRGMRLSGLRPLMEAAGKEYNVIFYEDGGCEIIPSGCTKAEGMKELAERMGISLSEIMVLGDNANDCEMLREAGIGAAVANSTREAREAADYICSNACTRGVAEAMERFCGLSD